MQIIGKSHLSISFSDKPLWESDRFRGRKDGRYITDVDQINHFRINDQQFRLGCESILRKFSSQQMKNIMQSYNIYASTHNQITHLQKNV